MAKGRPLGVIGVIACLLALTANAAPVAGEGSPMGAGSLDVHVNVFATVPTRSDGGTARLNSMAHTGNRLFAVASRDGHIYEVTQGESNLWFDVGEALAGSLSNQSFVEGGLRSLAFHPDFKINGKFFTSQEQVRPLDSNLVYLSDAAAPSNRDSVVMEWTRAPDGSIGSPREVLRIGHLGAHTIKQIAFDPSAQPGSPMYGLLHIAHGEGSNLESPHGGQGADGLGKILRIDPLASGPDPYSVPESNPFIGDSSMLDEVLALGLRNPHNLAFSEDGTLIVADIGAGNVEEINLIDPGGDYGWLEREGTFTYLTPEPLTGIAALPANDADSGYVYPAAQLVRTADSGPTAVAGGYAVENGSPLDGYYVYGEFATTGEIFLSALSDLRAATTTGPPQALSQAPTLSADIFFDHDDDPSTPALERSSMLDIIQESPHYDGSGRADLRFGQGPDGEIYMTSKRNNTIYLVTSSSIPAAVTKLTPSDGSAGAKFGIEVDISGNTLVVGAFRENGVGIKSGSVYVFVREGTRWTEQAKLIPTDLASGDEFGHSVQIEGDTIVVGSWLADAGAVDSGAAYVFTRTGSSWSQQAKLVAADADSGDHLGLRVGLSGDTVVVGAWQDDEAANNAGAAYVFTRTGSSWNQQAKLTASDAEAGEELGNMVAIDGDTAVIGAWRDDDRGANSGSAYVFTRTGSSWSEQQKLLDPTGGPDDRFGGRIGVSGDSLVVTAWRDDDEGINSGSAFVYVRNNGEWTLQTRLVPDDASARDAFGFTATMIGDRVVVGAVRDDDSQIDSGSAYVFERTDGTWDQIAKLTAPDPGPSDRFGVSATFVGNTIVVGAWEDDDNGVDSGSAYAFELDPVEPDPEPGAASLHVSVATAGVVNGLAFGAEDVLSFDADNSSWRLLFDGSDVIARSANVNALDVISETTINLSFDAPVVLPGVGTVDDSDVVQFTGQLGAHTSGQFSRLLDGSDVGLSTGGEDVDGLTVLSVEDGSFGLSTVGLSRVIGSFTIQDEDVVEFASTSTGSTTAGSFSPYFDGSSVGLSAYDVVGASANTAGSELYISVLGDFMTGGIAGDGNDVFVVSGDDVTQHFDGDSHGLGDLQIDALDIPAGASGTDLPPNAIDDGPSDESVVGDPFHVEAALLHSAASGSVEDLVANDALGIPAGEVVAFGGSSFGEDVSDNSAGMTATVSGSGLLGVGSDGSWTFTPDAGFIGEFTFDYRLQNPEGSSDASVIIRVGEQPVEPPGNRLYVSSTSSGTVDGIAFADEDVLAYELGSDTWELIFDGSKVGVAARDVDALHVVAFDDTSMILDLSFDGPISLAGLGTVDDSDVVRFTGTPGEGTTGTFSVVIDGSDLALTTSGEDVDALGMAAGGYVLSTLASSSIPGAPKLIGRDEDLLQFTAGVASIFFDGSDVGLGAEDLVATSIDPVSQDFYGSVLGTHTLDGLAGDGDDVFRFRGVFGDNTVGSFDRYFDGDLHRFGGEQIDALHVVSAQVG